VNTRWSVTLAVVGAGLIWLAAPSAAWANTPAYPVIEDRAGGLAAILVCAAFAAVTSVIALIGLHRLRACALHAESEPDREVPDDDG
jgi:hypothetical protein